MAYRNYADSVGFIVDQQGLGDFSTIQSAITAASSGTPIFVRPGTYTENLTLKAGVDIVSEESGPNDVTIIGKMSMSVAGTVQVSNVTLQTNGDYIAEITGSVVSNLLLDQCSLILTNHAGVHCTSSSGSTNIGLQLCSITSNTSQTLFVVTGAGNLYVSGCNSKGSASSPSTFSSSGLLQIGYSYLTYPIQTSGTASTYIQFSYFAPSIDASAFVFASSGSPQYAISSQFLGQVVINTPGSFTLDKVSVGSSQTNAITGTGTLFAGLITLNGSGTNINTSTIQNLVEYPSTATSVKADFPLLANGISGAPQTGDITLDVTQATTTTLGVASFETTEFSVSVGGHVTSKAITVSNGTGISVSGSPVNLGGTVTISATGSVATTFQADSGSATPSSNTLIISGSSTGLTTTGSGNTIGLTGILDAANGGTGVASPTAHKLPVSEGSSAFNFLGPLTNGQLLIGSTGVDPVPAGLTAGTGISITPGAGSITVAASSSVPLTFNGDSGSATPSANAITFTGAGTALTFVGSGSTMSLGGTLSVTHGGTGNTALTAHTVLIGEGLSAIGTAGPGTSGFTFIGAGGGSDPLFAAIGTNSGLTNHGVLIGQNNSAFVATSAGTTGQTLISAGVAADPLFAAIGTNSGLTNHGVLLGQNNAAFVATSSGTTGQAFVSNGAAADPSFQTLPVSGGGTGDTTLTAHQLLVGEGTAPVSSISSGTIGQTLISSGASADPQFVNIGTNSGLANHGVVLSQNNAAFVSTSPGTVGQAFVSNGSGADPSFQILPVTGGGTGLASLNAHALLVGNGTSPVDEVGPGASGLPLVAQGASADPIFTTLGVPGGGTGSTSFTAHAVLVGEGTSAVTAVGPGTSGFTFIGSGVSSDPVFAAIGTNSGLTNHCVVLAQNNSAFVTAAHGSSGDVLISNGAGGDPAFGPIGTSSGLTAHAVVVAENNSAFVAVGPGTSGLPLVANGVAADPAFQVLTVPGGGTGATTLTGILTGNGASAFTASTVTQHGVLVGGASNAVSSTSVGSTGQVLQANTGADPTYSTATYPSTTTINQILYSSAANTVTGLATANRATLVTSTTGVPSFTSSMTDGQVVIGSTAGTPAPATLTAGSGITITNAAGSITIASVTGGMAWVTTSASNNAISVNTGYVANRTSTAANFTLPATANVGDTFIIEGLGSAGWTVQLNSGQLIYVGSKTTTVSTGSIASTNAHDCVTINCIIANSTWIARSWVGNLTVA